MKGSCNIILDCGEGTLSQLIRLLGSKIDKELSMPQSCYYRHQKINQYTDEWLNDLKIIFISHPHADHHIGLPSLLYYMSKVIYFDLCLA